MTQKQVYFNKVETIKQEPGFDIIEEQKPHHNCGVAGVALSEGNPLRPAFIAARLLDHLQHRGEWSAGAAVAPRNGDPSEAVYADIGLVSNVLSSSNLEGLPDGEYAIAQNRYPTQGTRSAQLGNTVIQPIHRVGQNGVEFWLGHNGDFNFGNIKPYASDTYKASDMISHELTGSKDLPEAMSKVFSTIPDGAYSIVSMTRTGVLAVRDPFGRHPLFYGYSNDVDGFLVASETPALTNQGVAEKDILSLAPGFMARFRAGKEPEIDAFVENPKDPVICMLEAIYFARADGRLEDKEIYEVSKAAGALLALKDKRLDYDVVVPVPDSARAAAQGYAEQASLSSRPYKPYTEAFVRIGSHRSFTQDEQRKREMVADHKLQIIPSQVRDKKIVLVEDSIVRGTTMRKLVVRLKEFGAKEVHIRIAAPMLMDTCEYGIDIPTREELIAFQENGESEEIRQRLKADSLKYLEVPESRKALGGKLGKAACMKCFTGRRPKGNFVYRAPFK